MKSGAQPVADGTKGVPRVCTALVLSLLLGGCHQSHTVPRSDTRVEDGGVTDARSDTGEAQVRPCFEPTNREYEREVLAALNVARTRGTRCGERVMAPAPPLEMNPLLNCAALEYAFDVNEHGASSPRTRAPEARAEGFGYGAPVAGLAFEFEPTPPRSAGPRFAPTPDVVLERWLESVDSCSTLMSPSFTRVGVRLTWVAPPDPARYAVVALLGAP